jgi:Cu/Ag efflux pump CusA
MLSTGIRTSIGVKVIGTALVEIDKLAKESLREASTREIGRRPDEPAV